MIRQFINLTVVITTMILLFAACSHEYKVGGKGEAGGIIFYDSGSYGSKGWRYIEAAPSDWAGDEKDPNEGWPWDQNVTYGALATEVGTGRENTMIVLRNARNSNGSAHDKVTSYSNTYRGSKFQDWFLPSREELMLMYSNLHQKGLGDFNKYQVYWSSSEFDHFGAWVVDFSDGTYSESGKFGIGRVRPIRYF